MSEVSCKPAYLYGLHPRLTWQERVETLAENGRKTMLYSKVILFFLLGSMGVLAQSTMTCSSDDMRRHYCSADTRGGVQMVRQHSDAACIQGRTWGYDQRGIWV